MWSLLKYPGALSRKCEDCHTMLSGRYLSPTEAENNNFEKNTFNFLNMAFTEVQMKEAIDKANMLIQKSAEFNINPNAKNNNNWTPFLWACMECHSKIADILIQKSVELSIDHNAGFSWCRRRRDIRFSREG